MLLRGGGAHRGIGTLQLRSVLRCRAQSNILARQLRLRQSYWRACPCCVTGTLNAAMGMTAAAGAGCALRAYVFAPSFFIAEPKTWKMESLYTGFALLLIAIPSVEVRNSDFESRAKEVASDDDVKRRKSC